MGGYIWSVLLAFLPLCWLLGFAVGRMDHAAGRARRPGGFAAPSSHVSGFVNPETGLPRPTSTGCRPAGLRLVDAATPATPPGPSRTTGRTGSTGGLYIVTGTGGRPGTGTTAADGELTRRALEAAAERASWARQRPPEAS